MSLVFFSAAATVVFVSTSNAQNASFDTGGSSAPLSIVWAKSLPIDPSSQAISSIGGTELRALASMDGALYAANGYWRDTRQDDPALPGPQIFVLDAPSAAWRVDGEFAARIAKGPQSGLRRYQAVGALYAVRFDADRENHPLPQPRSILLASVWDRLGGLRIFAKAGRTGAWQSSDLASVAPLGSQVRSFGFHRDAVTGVERVFAGTNPDGIISGAYDPTGDGRIAWDTGPEAGLPTLVRAQRVMSLAECDGKLFATVGWDIYERQDGRAPLWKKVFTWGHGLPFNGSGGLRGLTAVPDPSGRTQDLLVVAEGRQGRILRIDPTGGFAAIVDLDVNDFLTRRFGTRIVASIVAYNDMTALPRPPGSGATCPALLLGGVDAKAPDAADTIGANHKLRGAYVLVRDCHGRYSVQAIEDRTIAPEPPLVATRALILSPFAADPAGTIYAGGFDAGNIEPHNSAWLYRGVASKTSISPGH